MAKSMQRMRKSIGTFMGLPVYQATRPLILTVTDRDVVHSKKRSPGECAGAKAICRQEHVDEAYVYLSRTFIRRKDHYIRYATPPRMRTEIVSFDRSKIFEPGEYKLMPLSPSQRTPGGHVKTKTGKSSRVQHYLSNVRARAPLA